MHDVEDFPAPPWRRRVLTVVLALGTSWLVMSSVLGRPGNPDYQPPPRADRAACQPGQTTGCVGGTAAVIVVQPASGPVR